MENEKFVVKIKKNYGETSVVSARLPVEIVKKLDTTANNTGRTRNELILMCIEFALTKLEVEELITSFSNNFYLISTKNHPYSMGGFLVSVYFRKY